MGGPMLRRAYTTAILGLLALAGFVDAAGETRLLRLPAASVVADPVRGLLYATVLAEGHPFDHQIVVIDPRVPAVTGTLVTSPAGAFLDQYVGGMAIDRDATVLYVITGKKIARVRLDRRAIDKTIALDAYE